MSSLRGPAAVLALALFSPSTLAQSPPPRDPRAVAVLTQSLTAMGGTVPADSTATGKITFIEGSKTQSGAIRILTRGSDQSFEEIQTPEERRAITYSQGFAKEQAPGADSEQEVSLELAVTSQSPDFPLVLIAALMNNSESTFEYVGIEKLDSGEAHHIRAWNTFQSKTKWQPLAPLSERHIWISAVSGLPVQITYERRAARGAEPAIPMAVFFSDFRNIGGVLYPFRIEKNFNGTPWATITIDNVAVNTGLTAAQFHVR